MLCATVCLLYPTGLIRRRCLYGTQQAVCELADREQRLEHTVVEAFCTCGLRLPGVVFCVSVC